MAAPSMPLSSTTIREAELLLEAGGRGGEDQAHPGPVPRQRRDLALNLVRGEIVPEQPSSPPRPGRLPLRH